MSGDVIKKEFGDYQTPLKFANDICLYLKKELKINPKIVLEPTCGMGNFLEAGLNVFANLKKAYGIEINPDYCEKCKKKFNNNLVSIKCDDFFSINLNYIIDPTEELLILGNPPWATNSEINFNLPKKKNFKNLSGTDAITGASNFDVCEYIILKLLNEFKSFNATIAMLCKTSVARNVFNEISRNHYPAKYVKMLNFNAKKIFDVNAPACLLVVKMAKNEKGCSICQVSDFDAPETIQSIITCDNGVLSNSNKVVHDLDGNCQFEWRQGVKHDCSKIMELKKLENNLYKNKNNEVFKIEEHFVYPLLKSSSFKKTILNTDFEKYVIVTQKKAKDETASIAHFAPLTWKYLMCNKKEFDNRKSSIYNNAPLFSMFGVGDYSYAQYKVGISGFYKKPLFSLIYNKENIQKPIMLDDTSYFLSFDNYDMAYVCMLILNSDTVQDFLYSISFQDAKRPYTKKVLQRINFKKCIDCISLQDLLKTEEVLSLNRYISPQIYQKFKSHIIYNENKQLSIF